MPFCFDYAGEHLVVGSKDGMVHRWQIGEASQTTDLLAKPLESVPLKTPARAIAIRNFGQPLAVAGGSSSLL